MEGFGKILFVIEGRPEEEAVLLDLARQVRAARGSLTLIEVLPEVPGMHGVPALRGKLERLHRNVAAERQKALRSRAAELRKAVTGLKLSTVLREGRDYIEIIRQVQEQGSDLLVKLNGSDQVEGVLFGTLDMKLLRLCPCPVLVQRRRRRGKGTFRVLAAVDLVRHDSSRENLDRLIVERAAAIAAAREGSLELLHAWHLPYEKKLKNEERLGFYKNMDTMLKELRATEKAHLRLLAQDHDALKPGLHLVKGKPEEVIPRYVAKHRCDLVVMGTVGRTGLAGFFIGNTAEKILRGLNSSVLALKPEGFVTPVS